MGGTDTENHEEFENLGEMSATTKMQDTISNMFLCRLKHVGNVGVHVPGFLWLTGAL